MAQKIVRQDNSLIYNTNLIVEGEVTIYEKTPKLIPLVGPQGPQGFVGPPGPSGGPAGAQGCKGDTGAIGNISLDGGPADNSPIGLKVYLDCGGVI